MHNKKNIIIVLALTASMLCSMPCFAYTEAATQPGDAGKSQAELNGYSEEDWAHLMDDTLEYDEIEDLIHNFNPTIVSAWNSMNENIDSLANMIDELKSAERSARNDKETATNSGDFAGIATYTMQEIIFDKAGDSMQKSLDILKRPVTSTNRPIRQAEAQVISGVRQLMIGYKSLLVQKQTLTDLVALYDETYRVQQALSIQGMATSIDVTKALADLQSAQANLASVEATENQLYRQLIVMCGWSETAQVTIGDIPAVDMEHINAMDPAVDISAAIGNNYTLITFRHTSYKKSPGATDAHLIDSEQQEANLLTNLTAQYNTVIADKQGYDAAAAGYAGAQITKAGSDAQYQLGLISKAQYLGTGIAYTQAKASYDAASMTLLQAAATYDDMVAGNASVE